MRTLPCRLVSGAGLFTRFRPVSFELRALVSHTRTAPLLKEPRAPSVQGDSSANSRRREYLDWVEDQIEEYKESISRSELLEVADEVVAELRINTRGQYQLTEVLLSEAVDRHIFRMLKLPTYRRWREAGARERRGTRLRDPVSEEPLPLP